MQIGSPLTPRTPNARRLLTFDRIPTLWDVLPNGGLPGVKYAQVCVANVKAAADREEPPDHFVSIEGAPYYTIVGPLGSADMVLLGSGEPIEGAAPEAGARFFFTDSEVETLTGLRVQYPIHFHPEVPTHGPKVDVAQGAARAAQGSQGDVRVQARHAPQRKRAGSAGQIAKASHRDRPVGAAPSEKELARRQAQAERMRAIWRAKKATDAQAEASD